MNRARTTSAALARAVAATLLLGGCGGVTFGQQTAQTSTGAAAPSSTAPSSPSTSEAPSPTSEAPEPSGTTAPTSEPTTSPTSSPSTSPTKPATPTKTPTPTPKPTQKKEGDTLQAGDSGPYVKQVQQRLTELGYWNGGADGTYGFLTSQAVMALQKAAGLGRDGVFGPATRRAMQAGIRPQSRTGGTGVEIDKARQLLLVVRGGRVTTILNTSTGSGQHYSYNGVDHIALTPAGSFSVFRTVDHLDKGPLGDLWRPRYFNGGIAVHGAGAIPGYPASHGCARVSNPAMDMIWANNLMPVGSSVVVY
ncbi:L,D-transpeptidase family protein [Phycicoccus sp. M110.8]|uniref:L,D-transpeptidase family protein n=1 Tax=Phycicoccus sp. M110.8 TaxID=3075433 RepID=UPI0028FD4644|nr:L,D-transpeptidase family protein [Phycicoccus sp. M110.8]MDU0314834.1 L,D-transpeptidase family protein [Phycicoccus sp. M110.8]